MNEFKKIHLHVFSFFKVQNKETKNKQPLVVKQHPALMPLSLSEALCATRACDDGANIGNCPTAHGSGGGHVSKDTWSNLKVRSHYLEGYFCWISQDTCFFFSPTGPQTKALGRRHTALNRFSLSDWSLIYMPLPRMTGCVSNTNTTETKSKKGIERVGKWFKK